MVDMGVDQVRIDLASLGDFQGRLAPRRLEAETALAALADPGLPELGRFHDAKLTAGQHDTLRQGFLLRLGRLINAIDAAQTSLAAAAETYRVTDDDNVSTLRASADGLPRG
jgi:hypothetical protein